MFLRVASFTEVLESLTRAFEGGIGLDRDNRVVRLKPWSELGIPLEYCPKFDAVPVEWGNRECLAYLLIEAEGMQTPADNNWIQDAIGVVAKANPIRVVWPSSDRDEIV